jgi:hypothetical protein
MTVLLPYFFLKKDEHHSRLQEKSMAAEAKAIAEAASSGTCIMPRCRPGCNRQNSENSGAPSCPVSSVLTFRHAKKTTRS